MIAFTTADQPAQVRRIFRDGDSRVQFLDQNGEIVYVASYKAELSFVDRERGVIAVSPTQPMFEVFYFEVSELTEIDVDGVATDYSKTGPYGYEEPTTEFPERQEKSKRVYLQLALQVFYECCGSSRVVANSSYYSSILPPQLFNPDASAVTANTDDYTLSSSNAVAFVTINGQTLDDSEYSLSGTTLTVAPDNGFNSTSDEVLVFQHSFAIIGNGGVFENYVQVNSTYTILETDYYVDCVSGTFTVTLPTAVGRQGQSFKIKNSGAGTITLDGNGAETIDGSATLNLSTGDALEVVSDGSNWKIYS